MTSIRVQHSIGDLADDLAAMPAKFIRGASQAVRKNIREGNRIAKASAKESAGSHGRLYHLAFSSEMTGVLEGEYGPDASMPQGDMSFERGSRNQPWHGDLAKSADVVGPKFAEDIGGVIDDLFWGAEA